MGILPCDLTPVSDVWLEGEPGINECFVSTVQKREAGEKRPSGPSLKLLNLIERKGPEAVI